MKSPFDWIARLLRIGIGGIFLYAAFAKLNEARAFTASVVMLQVVPFRWAEWLAAMISLAELLAGAWLIVGWRLRASALAAMLLAAAFAFASGQAMIRELEFNCHCFGITAQPPPAGLVLVRALLLLGLATLLRWLANNIPAAGSQAAARSGAREVERSP